MLRVKETRGCDVIIIDYAGIMEEVVRGEQSWNTYSNLYLRLKALARELDVVMITPVQSLTMENTNMQKLLGIILMLD